MTFYAVALKLNSIKRNFLEKILESGIHVKSRLKRKKDKKSLDK